MPGTPDQEDSSDDDRPRKLCRLTPVNSAPSPAQPGPNYAKIVSRTVQPIGSADHSIIETPVFVQSFPCTPRVGSSTDLAPCGSRRQEARLFGLAVFRDHILFEALSDHTLCQREPELDTGSAVQRADAADAIVWADVGRAESVQDMAASRRHLFALDIRGDIWRMQLANGSQDKLWRPWFNNRVIGSDKHLVRAIAVVYGGTLGHFFVLTDRCVTLR